MSEGLSIRTGRVKRDRRGRETGVVWDVDLSRLWDGLSHGATIQTFLVGIEETAQAEDQLRLWDGVALWVALTTIADMQREERERQIRAEAGHP